MPTPFPTLRTSRLLLRRFRDEDLDNVFSGLSHPNIIKYYGVSYATREATKEQMKFFAEQEASGAGIWWAVCSLDGQIFYGAGGINSLNKEHRKAEVGFWLLEDHWGKGIMTEAMPLICAHGFERMGIHRLEGFVESENENSKKALAKLNFRHEGRMRECEIKNGRFISLDIYSMLKSEFGERRSSL